MSKRMSVEDEIDLKKLLSKYGVEMIFHQIMLIFTSWGADPRKL